MTDTRIGRRPAGLVLALLLLVYILNFLDRQILGILAPPIKAELHLTDTQFGAIGGLAFALLYSVLGVPLALLADRTSRSGVVTAALVVWSGFTALCGVAVGFWQLFLFRLGVGIGEAGRCGAVLCAGRRLLPADAAVAGAGHLFAGRADRWGAGRVPGRVHRPARELADRFHDGRHRRDRAGAGVSLGGARRTAARGDP